MAGWPEIDGATLHVRPHPQIVRTTASEASRKKDEEFTRRPFNEVSPSIFGKAANKVYVVVTDGEDHLGC